jgi:hypothetical protein
MKTKLVATLATLALLSSAHGGENVSGVPIPASPTLDTSDPVTHGRQIAEHADLFDRGWFDEVSQGQMTLFDAGGDSVQRTFTRMVLEDAESGDKIITRFMSPAEIKGVAALTHEKPADSDDSWLYLPANKRVRRISGANKTASFQGTEFTYEDLSNLEIVEYDWRFLDESELEVRGEKIPVYRVEARPTYKDTGYSRLVVYYHRTEWRRERIEYYDKANRLLKTQTGSDWNQLHGRFWRANATGMENHQTGKVTELRQDRIYLNLRLYKSSKTGKARPNLDESRFTTQALQL